MWPNVEEGRTMTEGGRAEVVASVGKTVVGEGGGGCSGVRRPRAREAKGKGGVGRRNAAGGEL